jgi:hypothetical protein
LAVNEGEPVSERVKPVVLETEGLPDWLLDPRGVTEFVAAAVVVCVEEPEGVPERLVAADRVGEELEDTRAVRVPYADIVWVEDGEKVARARDPVAALVPLEERV